jgi:chromate transport protein ChrA
VPAIAGEDSDGNREGEAARAHRDLVKYYLRFGLLGFGGPVALVGQMQREMVGGKKWLTKEEMREGIAICQSLPGPLAIQVGIWISYIRGGFWGAWAGGWAFILLPNFVIVAAMGALYVHFGGLPWVTAIFYGVSPAVIALILHSCYRLTKLGMDDWLQWALAAPCFAVTVAVQAEVALLFIVSGVVGPTTSLMLGVPLVATGTAPGQPRRHARQALHVLPQGGVPHVRQRPRDRPLPREGSRAADGVAPRAGVLGSPSVRVPTPRTDRYVDRLS